MSRCESAATTHGWPRANRWVMSTCPFSHTADVADALTHSALSLQPPLPSPLTRSLACAGHLTWADSDQSVFVPFVAHVDEGKGQQSSGPQACVRSLAAKAIQAQSHSHCDCKLQKQSTQWGPHSKHTSPAKKCVHASNVPAGRLEPGVSSHSGLMQTKPARATASPHAVAAAPSGPASVLLSSALASCRMRR